MHMADLTRVQRAGWAGTVVADLHSHGRLGERLTVLAGALYNDPLEDARVPIEPPLQDLGSASASSGSVTS